MIMMTMAIITGMTALRVTNEAQWHGQGGYGICQQGPAPRETMRWIWFDIQFNPIKYCCDNNTMISVFPEVKYVIRINQLMCFLPKS